MRSIITVLLALFVASSANAQAPAAPAALTPPASVKVTVRDTTAPAVDSKVRVVPLPPAAGYMVTREGDPNVELVFRSDCSTGGCSAGAAPPASAPDSTDKPASDKPASDKCTIGWCFFTRIASWIGAGGAFLLEIGLGLAGLALVIGGAFYFLRRLAERRHDRRWHRRSARLRGRYREAIVARNAATDPAERTRWARRVERRWALLTGHLEIENNPDDDESDLPPPPDLGDAAEE